MVFNFMKMIGRFTPSLIAVLVGYATVWAADMAEMRPVGFSSDGRYFAFDEFGIQDRSRFPYASRFVIDTKSDRFAAGAPVGIINEDESQPLLAAGEELENQSKPLKNTYKFDAAPGKFVVFNPPTEIRPDKSDLTYALGTWRQAIDAPFHVTLETYDIPQKSICDAWKKTLKGFRLTLEGGSKNVFKILHQDKRIPRSRGCKTDYQVGGAMIYTPVGQPQIHVIFIIVSKVGFEGQDRRWMAVTTRVAQ